MKSPPPSEHDEQDRDLIELLKDLGTLKPAYPPELLTARRAAFLAQVDELTTSGAGEASLPEDQGLVKILGAIRAAQAEYPPELLAARRSALLQRLEGMEVAEEERLWHRLRTSFQGMFSSLPIGRFLRTSLVVASLIAVMLVGSLFLSRARNSLQPLPLGSAGESTRPLPPGPGGVAIAICRPDDETPACASGESDPSHDLANHMNGTARPAVAKDGVHSAAYVNDGRGGASWVSNSPHSWIKIDLGTVRTINTVNVRKGSASPSGDSDPGQFVIAVAVSDVYADGDSMDDYTEYAQVFHSEPTGFSGRVSPADRIQTRFPPVQARFVKITFEKAGAAIEEVGVFLVEPPALAELPTGTLPATLMEITHTTTGSLLAIATQTSTPTATGTRLPTETAALLATNTSLPTASNTPITLPTNTLPPADPATPVPTRPLPSNTPRPSPTPVPPTAIPPTALSPTSVPPTDEPPPPDPEPIIVTGNNQTVTFTCNGNEAEIRGHSNTVTLLGACSSIRVTGNGNHVYWESGSPIITITGQDNIVQQL
jgi:hypothetical protein